MDSHVQEEDSLLVAHTSQKSYHSGGYDYPGIKVFWHKINKGQDGPSERTVHIARPVLVFIHGLGGSTAQFEQLITRLSKKANSCLAVDLPGCGNSDFAPTTWGAYTTDAMVELLELVIDKHISQEDKIVLVGHSMGAALAAKIAYNDIQRQNRRVAGLVAICPPGGPPPADLRKLLWVWPPKFFNPWLGRLLISHASFDVLSLVEMLILKQDSRTHLRYVARLGSSWGDQQPQRYSFCRK